MDPLVALAAPTTLAAGSLGLHLRRWGRRHSDAWNALDRIGPDLVAEFDEAGILRTALLHSLTIFRCEAAAVVLYPHGSGDGLIASVSAIQGEGDVQLVPLGDSELPTGLPRGALEVDLVRSGASLGRLTLHGIGRARRITRRRLLRAFTQRLTSAVAAARMYEVQRRSAEASYLRTLRDTLTPLGNRALLEQQGPRGLASASARDRKAALLLLDLNDFKRVNDTLGHEAGDRVLTEVGLRILNTVRRTDLAVRLGGDEFAVLATDLRSGADAEQVAQRVLQALTPAVRLDDVDLVVPASIGIAVQGEAGSSIASLLRSADRAMYEAKAAGGAGWRRALPAPVEDPSTRTPTGDELRQALRRDQIVVHYQPQVDAYDGTVLGFEALVRWQHPHLGLLAPAAIVPLADRSGLMRELLSSVVDRAVHDHVRLQELRPGSTISVNVTARNLLDQGLVIDIEQTLARHGTAAAQLTLEIVEPPAASVSIGGVLAGLERLGCSVSVQEFGTGQASLIALHSYRAIREIKVAPELTGAVLVDPAARRLVRAMVSTAHGLGVRVVGEGVESAELVRSLRDLGCDRLQGFHILPPAPLDDLEGWLARPDRPDLRSDLAHNGVR